MRSRHRCWRRGCRGRRWSRDWSWPPRAPPASGRWPANERICPAIVPELPSSSIDPSLKSCPSHASGSFSSSSQFPSPSNCPIQIPQPPFNPPPCLTAPSRTESSPSYASLRPSETSGANPPPQGNTVAPKQDQVLPLFSLKGKTAIVSGAGAGIGLAVAHGFAEAGANVAIWYNSNKKAIERAEEIEKKYGVKCKSTSAPTPC